MNRITRILTIAVLTWSCATLSFAQTEFRAWNTHPEGYPVTVALGRFAEFVRIATEGRYVVKVFSNGVLGDQPVAVRMLKAGELDIAEFNLAPLSEAAPGTKALTLPFLFRDATHMFRQVEGKLGPRFEAKLAEAGYIVLGWYDGGARSFYCTRPIQFVSNLAGMRIRVQQSETAIEMVKLLRATPVVLPYKEVSAAFSEGRIDCAEGSMVSYEATGHYKLAKFMYLSNHQVTPEALVISTKAWKKLSGTDQAAMRDAGRKSALLMRDLWARRVEEARAATEKQGAQFTVMRDHGTLVARMRPMYEKYLSDPATREDLYTILADLDKR